MKFFTADQHFGHKNIIEYCNRPFSSVEEMDHELIRKYREKVSDEDEVYFLGDFTMKGPDNKAQIEKIIKRLPGRKHLILGNHDRLRPFEYVDMGFITVHTGIDFPEDNVTLYHDPAVHAALPDTRYLYCGHVHDLFKVCKRVLNVGVDVWGYYPVSVTQIWDFLYREVIWKTQAV